MLRILDLFAGKQNVRKALFNKYGILGYEYYGVDIVGKGNYILDLSQDDIIKKLEFLLPDGWKPDFIWASPVCNKFSIATAVKGGNLYFEKTRTGVKIREDFKPLENSVYKNMDHQTIQDDAKLHLKLVANMQRIIDYFDCDFVIENPTSSLYQKLLKPVIRYE